MNPHFIAHEPSDTVGVVVVEKVKTGQEVTGWLMDCLLYTSDAADE